MIKSGGVGDEVLTLGTLGGAGGAIGGCSLSLLSTQHPPNPPTTPTTITTTTAHQFRKILDETILSCSPHIKYTVPYLESEAGRKCILRRYFQPNLYVSVLLESGNYRSNRRTRFHDDTDPTGAPMGSRTKEAAKYSRDVNQNIELRPPHPFTKIKVTGDVTHDDIQTVLADFRARGGKMRNVCVCESGGGRRGGTSENGRTINQCVGKKMNDDSNRRMKIDEKLMKNNDREKRIDDYGIRKSDSGIMTNERGKKIDNNGIRKSDSGMKAKEDKLERKEEIDSDINVGLTGLQSSESTTTTTTQQQPQPTQQPETNQWSGQSSIMLTSAGRYDALHAFNHQRLSLLFSSHAQDSDTPTFCVNPWVLTMDFYGGNDIPLGAFLEQYCFSPTYTCPSTHCSVPVLNHTRKFVHDSACVDVLLRRLDKPLEDPTTSGAILMWSWCRICRQVSAVRSMSLETWSLSFAKYLELRFYGSGLTRQCASGCKHSLHHHHYQYFGHRDQIAVFKYNVITVREVALPPTQMKLSLPPISQSAVLELIKGVAIKGYSVFSTILERVTTLLSECDSRWQPLIVEISEHQNQQRAVFRSMIERIQIQLTSPTLECAGGAEVGSPTHTTTSTREVTNTMLTITDQVTLIKRHIAQVITHWNNKVQDLVHLRKKEEKLEKAKTQLAGSGGSGSGGSGSGSILRQSTTSTTSTMGDASYQQQQQRTSDTSSITSSSALTSLSPSTLTDSLALTPSLTDLMPGREDSPKMYTGGVEGVLGLEGDAAFFDEVDAITSTPLSQPCGMERSLVEERDRLLHSFPLTLPLPLSHQQQQQQQFYLSTHSGTSGVSLSSTTLSEGEREQQQQQHRRQASDTCEGIIGRSGGATPPIYDPLPAPLTPHCTRGGHERSQSDGGTTTTTPTTTTTTSNNNNSDKISERRLAVKNIISTFWSSSVNLMVETPFSNSEHYLLLPEVKIPIVVYGEEPSSIIAHALTSQEYHSHLAHLHSKMRTTIKDDQQTNNNTSSTTTTTTTTTTTDTQTDTQTTATKASKEFHIEMQWNDQHAKFYCKIFFAEQFRQLRKMVFTYGEDLYIRSLSRCILWEARGGKSGSVFCKSHDDRFILKEMSRFEMTSFLDFGPAYIDYVMNCEKEHQPTVLTRIVGVYRIGYKNSVTNKAQRMDVLVMENLFYQRNITHKFDLKGSIRNRLVNTSGKEESDLVLLDENLLRMACSSPLYIRPHSKTVLNRSLAADTVFLSQQLIMDYSLLVGIDHTTNELIIGIIDYIRTFTWDKKLETIIKGSVLGGGAGRLPTVVSPEVYRTRFCHAMDRYFLLTPDRWTGLGLGVDP